MSAHHGPAVRRVLPGLMIGLLGLVACMTARPDIPSAVPPVQAAPAGTPEPGAPAGTPGPVSSVPDLAAHSTTDPSSVWVVVNKRRPIRPPDFRPSLGLVRGYQVAEPAVRPLTRLLAAADRAGLGFKIASAFRSYDYQRGVYGGIVADRGRAAADRVSARPGHSEHQTGLAVDLVTPTTPRCDLDRCFATTRAGRWLREHAWEHGFVIRYPRGKEPVTGYSPEPWHLRYVGRPLAAYLHAGGPATLEEVFGIPGGDYRDAQASR